MRRRRPLHGHHVKHSQFSSPPSTHQRARKHVTVTATNSPLGRHVELALKDTQYAQKDLICRVDGSHREKHEGSGCHSNDVTGRLFQIYDDSSTIDPDDGRAHDRNQSGDGPPPPSAVKTRRPLDNVSNHSCTSVYSPSAKSLDKSKKWEERMLNIGLKTEGRQKNSPVMGVTNNILLEKNDINDKTSVSNYSSISDANNTGHGASADYVQFDVHALHNYRGTKLSPKSQGGLFSPSSRDEYPTFNGGVKEIESDRDGDDFCGHTHDEEKINFDSESLESIKTQNNDCIVQTFHSGNDMKSIYQPQKGSSEEISGDICNIVNENMTCETGENSASLDSKRGGHNRSEESLLSTLQAKCERKSPNDARVRKVTSKPPLYQGDRSDKSSPLFTPKRSHLYQRTVGSMGSNSESSSIEVAECVADITDQSSGMKVQSQISETSSNTTKEIAECVADVIDQPMPIFQNFETNSTVEIAECVADIMEQSIASSTQMESINSRNKSYITSSSRNEEERYLTGSDKIVAGAMAVQHHQPNDDSDTQTTTEIAECVVDLLEQTMAGDGLMEVMHDRAGDSETRTISSFSPNMIYQYNNNSRNATSDEGKKLPLPHIDIMKQMQKERVARLLEAMTLPPPPPPPLPPPPGGTIPYVTESITRTNCESPSLGSFSLSDSSCSTAPDKLSYSPPSDMDLTGAKKNLSYQREVSNDGKLSTTMREKIPNAVKTRISSTHKKQFETLSTNASQHMSSGSYSDALDSFQDLLKCQKSALGKANPLVASTIHNIGIVHTKRALVAKSITDEEKCNVLALRSFRDAASVARQALGPNHPNVAVSLVRIGLILLQAGRYSEAIVTFQECLRIRQNALGGGHFLVARVFNNLGVAHLHINDYELSLKEFESACSIHRLALERILKEKNYEPTDLKVCQAELELADSLSNIGSICLDWVERNSRSNHLNKHSDLCKKAVGAFNEAIQLRINHLGKEHELVQDLEQMKLDADQMLQMGPRVDSSDIRTAVSILAVSRDRNMTHHHNDTTMGRFTVPVDTPGSSNHLLDEESCLMSNSRIESSISPWDESSITSSKSTSTSGQASRQIHVLRPIEYDSTPSQQSIQSKENDAPSIKGVDEWDPFENGAVDNNLEIPVSPFEVMQQSSKSAFESFDSSLAHVHQASAPGNCSFDGVQLGKTDSLYNISFHGNSIDDEFKSDPTKSNPPHAKASPTVPMHHIQPKFESVTTSSINEKEMVSDPKRYSSQIQLRAYQYLKNEKFVESLSLFRILLLYFRSEYGLLHHDVGSTLHNIGILYLRLKDYKSALKSFQEAVRVRRGAIGRDHADVAVSLVKVGITQLLLRNFDDALYSFREALSVRRHALGHLHPSTARIYNNIGCVHVEFNQLREARRAFESALDVQRNALCYEPESASLLFGGATTLCNLGYLYALRGLHAKACSVLHEAVGFQEQVLGPLHPSVLSILSSLADSYEQSGDIAKALTSYKEILTRLKDCQKYGHDLSQEKKRALGTILYKMSILLRKQNDLDAALRLLTDSLYYYREFGASELVQKVEEQLTEVKKILKQSEFDWV